MNASSTNGERALHFSVQLPAGLVEAIAVRAAEIVLERQRDNGSSSPYMSVPEAADYLRCKRQRIDDLLSSHRLTRYKEGGRTLVLRAELAEYVRAGNR
jgi:excisionase family DNA binding protein